MNNGQPFPTDGYFDFVDSNGQRLLIDTMYIYISHGINYSTTINCSQYADYLMKIRILLKDTGVYIMGLGGGSVSACVFSNRPQNFFSYIDYNFNLTDFNADIYTSVPPNLRREGGVDFSNKQFFVFDVTE